MRYLKNILSVMCSLILLITISITAVENPEPLLTDDTEDVMGLIAKILPQEELSFLDIESVWFTENPDNPDCIYMSIKFVDLTMRKWHTIYSIKWEYKGEIYFVSVVLISGLPKITASEISMAILLRFIKSGFSRMATSFTVIPSMSIFFLKF